MTISVPTLSAQGWITDFDAKVDAILAFVLTSQYSQTYCYHGQITSVQKILQQTGNKSKEAAVLLENKLSDIFKRYFDSAKVTVEVIDDPSVALSTLRIMIEADDKGVQRVTGRLMSAGAGRLNEFVKINNG